MRKKVVAGSVGKKTTAAVRRSAAAVKPAVKAVAKVAAKVARKTADQTAKKAVNKTDTKTGKKPVTISAKNTVTTAVKKPVKQTVTKRGSNTAGQSSLAAKAAISSRGAKSRTSAVAKPQARGGKGASPLQDQAVRPSLVRDSFTMPEQEYAVLAQVKQACLKAGIDIKKSELLRISVALLGRADMKLLQRVLAELPQLKTGRPKRATD